jgi:hypothetical protein
MRVRHSPFEEGMGHGWCSPKEGNSRDEIHNSDEVGVISATGTAQTAEEGDEALRELEL